MFIEFTVKNFLSFKNEVTFSMLAAKSLREASFANDGFSNLLESSFGVNKFLRLSSVYGANGSGKSNLVKAMSFFRTMILDSVKNDRILKDFPENQFRFDTSTETESSGFQILFSIDKTKYRYGFEILGEKIESEWLFMQGSDSQKESYCFKRDSGEIQVNSKTFKEGKVITGMTRDNALFLSTAAQFNVSGAILIKNWFVNKFNILSGINDNTLNYTAIQYLKNPNMRSRILDFIKLIDIGIQDISVTENIIESFSESRMIPDDPLIQKILGSISDSMVSSGGKIKELDILSSHNKYEGEKIVEKTYLPFRNESIGTIKIFALLGPWLETLHKGGVLVIDDFGSSIHTKLALELMRLFQSKLNNGEAQLIVTTHDTNLLRKDVLRRDQIWFVEKDAKGVSDVYSLLEYRVNQASCVRNDASFSKDYLLGTYGAIPYFGNIEKFISDYSTNED